MSHTPIEHMEVINKTGPVKPEADGQTFMHTNMQAETTVMPMTTLRTPPGAKCQ